MTPADVRSLPPLRLLGLFLTLSAGKVPLGRYDGIAWSHDYPQFAGLMSRFWQGKTFAADRTVTNRVLGLPVVRGTLSRHGDGHPDPSWQGGVWIIDYPTLGLYDELRWCNGFWLGRMPWRDGWIWFTLTSAKEKL